MSQSQQSAQKPKRTYVRRQSSNSVPTPPPQPESKQFDSSIKLGVEVIGSQFRNGPEPELQGISAFAKTKAQLCCIVTGSGSRCQWKGTLLLSNYLEETAAAKNLFLRVDSSASPRLICEGHRTTIERAPYANVTKPKPAYGNCLEHEVKKPPPVVFQSVEPLEYYSASEEGRGKTPEEFKPDWNALEMPTLLQYVKVWGIPGNFDGLSKREMIKIVSNHFQTIKVEGCEKQIMSEFVRNVRRD